MHHTQLLMTSNRCDLGRQLTGNTLPWTQWVPVCLQTGTLIDFKGLNGLQALPCLWSRLQVRSQWRRLIWSNSCQHAPTSECLVLSRPRQLRPYEGA
jgi:hypothetical protein